MSEMISQIQMVYAPEEDRILFRLNTTDKKEYRFWITRRYAMLLLKVLNEHKAADPDVSAQVTDQAKEAIQDFKQEKAIGEATFSRKFEGSDNEFPLGQVAQLAFKLTYKINTNGNLHIGIRPKEDDGVNVVLNQDVNFSLTRLLLTAARKGSWKLDVGPLKSPENSKENMLIN